MKKDRKTIDLQQEKLKKPPFKVPEGYFESFSERLQERIREEDSSQVPVRSFGSGYRFRLVMAAAIVGLALITYSVIKFTTTENDQSGNYPEMAILEELQVFDDDRYLLDLIEEEVQMDEEEAFASQAIEYLAMNDAEMVLLFE